MHSMRRFERMVRDPELIASMLDLFDTAHIGLFDNKYPYVVPLNFGYEIKDNKLFIYVHCAPEGHKVDLIERNPNVCVTFSKFSNFPHQSYRGHIHDYRSVMAFGTISKIDRKKDSIKFSNALKCMIKKYGADSRSSGGHNDSVLQLMEVYAVECEWAEVYGKSEQPIRTPADVPIVDARNMPTDDVEHDVSDLISKKHYL